MGFIALLMAGDSLPGEHRCYAVDVRDRAALHAAASDFIAFCQGRVDVVIASAGISAGTLTEHGEDYDVFKAIVDTNLLATVATFKPFIASMRAAGSGRLAGRLVGQVGKLAFRRTAIWRDARPWRALAVSGAGK